MSIAQLAALVPQYADQADKMLQSYREQPPALRRPTESAEPAVSSIDPAKLVALIGTVLAGLSGLLTSLVFLLCLMLFLSVEAGGVDQRLAAVAADRPQLERPCARSRRAPEAIWWSPRCSALIVGVLDSAALAIIGVPLPVLWGVLSFLTNFIPNIGFIIGLVPPGAAGPADGRCREMLVVIAVYCVLNLVIQSLIQPRFVGDSVGLAMTRRSWRWCSGPGSSARSAPCWRSR